MRLIKWFNATFCSLLNFLIRILFMCQATQVLILITHVAISRGFFNGKLETEHQNYLQKLLYCAHWFFLYEQAKINILYFRSSNTGLDLFTYTQFAFQKIIAISRVSKNCALQNTTEPNICIGLDLVTYTRINVPDIIARIFFLITRQFHDFLNV